MRERQDGRTDFPPFDRLELEATEEALRDDAEVRGEDLSEHDERMLATAKQGADELGRLRISLDGVSRDYARCQELFEALGRDTGIEARTGEELVAQVVNLIASRRSLGTSASDAVTDEEANRAYMLLVKRRMENEGVVSVRMLGDLLRDFVSRRTSAGRVPSSGESNG